MKAIGLVETKGLVGLAAATDAIGRLHGGRLIYTIARHRDNPSAALPSTHDTQFVFWHDRA